MSGGNQQKVVIAKWLATEPTLLIIDEPTRGIDVGTKAEVHRLLSELAGQGMAILMISSELPEVLGMADRVLVVCEGRITADIARDEATPENVMQAATRTREAGGMSEPTGADHVSDRSDQAQRRHEQLVAPSRLSAGQRAVQHRRPLPRGVDPAGPGRW